MPAVPRRMRSPSRTIPADVADVLRRARTTDNLLYLPPEQLDRRLYAATNDVLASLGGVWKSGKVKAHVFPAGTDAGAVLAAALDTGGYATAADLAFFPTPTALAERMVRLAGITKGSMVLEPSAGDGAIARVIRATGANPQCFEIDEKRHQKLYDAGYVSCCVDFLKVDPVKSIAFDAVVMNPPFALVGQPQADLDHVTHAAKFLRHGGAMVAIVAGGVLFRDNARTTAFRAMVDARGGTIAALPDDTFKSAGTAVRTALVTFRTPA